MAWLLLAALVVAMLYALLFLSGNISFYLVRYWVNQKDQSSGCGLWSCVFLFFVVVLIAVIAAILK